MDLLYRYNIEPEMGIPDGKTKETQIGWQCREIRIGKADKSCFEKRQSFVQLLMKRKNLHC